jgi:hypothetical protein
LTGVDVAITILPMVRVDEPRSPVQVRHVVPGIRQPVPREASYFTVRRAQ